MWLNKQQKTPLLLNVKHLHREPKPKKPPSLASEAKAKENTQIYWVSVLDRPQRAQEQVNEVGKCLFISLIK